jgi:RNA polymerase sigma-70 factor, ECF subfamily
MRLAPRFSFLNSKSVTCKTRRPAFFSALAKKHFVQHRLARAAQNKCAVDPKNVMPEVSYIEALELCSEFPMDSARLRFAPARIVQLAAPGGDDSVALPLPLGHSAAEERRDPSHREQIVQLFREIRTPLYSYLVCIGLKPHEADDIVQEAFLRLHRQLASGANIDEPRAWVFRVARNVSLNVHRVERRLISESGLDPKEDLKLQQRLDPEQNPEEVYLKREAMRRLGARITQLTEAQRQCLYLRAQGLRYREIAVVLGISVSSAAELLQRAVVKLNGEIHA